MLQGSLPPLFSESKRNSRVSTTESQLSDQYRTRRWLDIWKYQIICKTNEKDEIKYQFSVLTEFINKLWRKYNKAWKKKSQQKYNVNLQSTCYEKMSNKYLFLRLLHFPCTSAVVRLSVAAATLWCSQQWSATTVAFSITLRLKLSTNSVHSPSSSKQYKQHNSYKIYCSCTSSCLWAAVLCLVLLASAFKPIPDCRNMNDSAIQNILFHSLE